MFIIAKSIVDFIRIRRRGLKLVGVEVVMPDLVIMIKVCVVFA